jgi:hypothetical protein
MMTMTMRAPSLSRYLMVRIWICVYSYICSGFDLFKKMEDTNLKRRIFKKRFSFCRQSGRI